MPEKYRWDLINTLSNDIYQYDSYLEIGCESNICFDKIKCRDKTGVDPKSGGTIRATSDEFFSTNKKFFDIIFIDGLHLYEQVLRDISNSIVFLNPNGTIVLHDCNPTSEAMQGKIDDGIAWTGDVWRAILLFRQFENYETSVIDMDNGCGIIRKVKNRNILGDVDYKTIPYHDFELNKTNYLNLMTWDQFFRNFKTEVPC